MIVAVDGEAGTPDARGARRGDGRAAGRLARHASRSDATARRKRDRPDARSPAAAARSAAIVGIYLEPDETIHLPIRVSIDAHGVGGPSAGLAFALEVLAAARPQRRPRATRSQRPARSTSNGQVGPIGGIEQKTIGAREAGVDAFLVPAGQNATDARKYAHGLRIIPVKSFQQALHALATLPEDALETCEFWPIESGRKLRVFSSGKPLIAARARA